MWVKRVCTNSCLHHVALAQSRAYTKSRLHQNCACTKPCLHHVVLSAMHVKDNIIHANAIS